jgi:hypothetical protein
MTREQQDCGPVVSESEELEEECRLHELASLTVADAMDAVTTNTPTPRLTVAQVQRQLTTAFGRDVTHVANGRIRSRRENH